MTKSRLSVLLCTAALGLAAVPTGATAASAKPTVAQLIAQLKISPAQLQQLLAYASTLTTAQITAALKSVGLTPTQISAVLIYLGR